MLISDNSRVRKNYFKSITSLRYYQDTVTWKDSLPECTYINAKKKNQGYTLKVILIFQTLSNDIEKYQDNVDALRNSGGEVERRVSQRDKDLVEDRLK